MVFNFNFKEGPAVPSTVEQLTEIFKRYDTNQDRQLSMDELKAAFKYLGAHFGYLRARLARHHADADKDGLINLDSPEFHALVEYAHSCGYSVSK